MCDLINREDVIKCLQENGWWDDIDELIETIPTAYDIDKVVERLELHSFELGTDTLPAHYVRLNDAIEIVKQGGVSETEQKLKEMESN